MEEKDCTWNLYSFRSSMSLHTDSFIQP